ncbi:MAG TPA: hypothetical protein VIM98_20465 [Dyella sp.]|uniref:hypothetical protein n=1 Tax=Dyella sp. TaxID=1869338 RepID=UPI002F91EA17
MTILHKPSFSARGIGLAAAVLLFVLAALELLSGNQADANIWRGVALGALYLCLCLAHKHAGSSSLWIAAPHRTYRRPSD